MNSTDPIMNMTIDLSNSIACHFRIAQIYQHYARIYSEVDDGMTISRYQIELRIMPVEIDNELPEKETGTKIGQEEGPEPKMYIVQYLIYMVIYHYSV